MKIDISGRSSIPSVFDTDTHELSVSHDTTIEEFCIRKMKDMRSLFLNADGYDDEMPLYYMYNGIFREKHRAFFKNQHIKYEYTVLMNTLINNEHVKAHGHIHGYNELKHSRHIEAYEILHGEGYFELFKFVGNMLKVILIQTKPGDCFIVPSDYYHLSINTGQEPYIFGDLIIEGAENDYSFLKDKNGAPLYAMFDGERSVFRMNPSYNDFEIEILHTDVKNLPWPNPLDQLPLYAHFITNPEKFEFLK